MYVFNLLWNKARVNKIISYHFFFKEQNIEFKTLFSGQHSDLIKEFSELVNKPDFELQNIMKHGQSINSLTGKILLEADKYC